MWAPRALLFIGCLTAVRGSDLLDPTHHPSWILFDQKKCGNSASTSRIIGGYLAELGSYPWLVRLGYFRNNSVAASFRCGGVLISEMYVVTAAHCLKDKNYISMVIRLGEYNPLTDPDCDDSVCAPPVQDIGITEIIQHEDYYKPSAHSNDIGLLRLKEKAVFSQFVRPICMPSGHLMDKDYIGEITEVAGWGLFDHEFGKPSAFLKAIKMPVVSLSECSNGFVDLVLNDTTQMCVGGTVGQDSCGGDSGGPLMKVEVVDDRPPRYYLLGVVSFGAKSCGSTVVPGVYTRMTTFMEWILDHMRP